MKQLLLLFIIIINGIPNLNKKEKFKAGWCQLKSYRSKGLHDFPHTIMPRA